MDQIVIIITAVVAGMAAYWISVELGKGAVLGSALVALAG